MPRSMKLVSWNIRGMSSDFKKRYLRKLVADKKPEFLLRQESKLEVVDRFIMQRIWFDADFEFAEVPAEGASGGVITIWNNSVFKVEEVISRKNFILIRDSDLFLLENLYEDVVLLAAPCWFLI